MDTRDQVLALCDLLYNKKAQDIVAINVADKTIIADWFIICSGRVQAQTKALCDEIEEHAQEFGLMIRRRDGYADARWIVLDFGHILLHIFLPDERKYYNMERLWIDNTSNAILYSQEQDASAPLSDEPAPAE